jgi:hypothetical protein
MRAGLSLHLGTSSFPRSGAACRAERYRGAQGRWLGWGSLDTSSRGTVTGGAGAHAG